MNNSGYKGRVNHIGGVFYRI